MTKQEYIGLYSTIQDYTVLYRTIQDYTGLYRTIQDYTGLYRILLSKIANWNTHTHPHQTKVISRVASQLKTNKNRLSNIRLYLIMG